MIFVTLVEEVPQLALRERRVPAPQEPAELVEIELAIAVFIESRELSSEFSLPLG
eukprot:CAMPEP_0194507488 /NCGR_PEP_ID=MMETSP0253-20130528/37096_1 /TAXON_ID=2966 /ORGANISM="Noctiluca scintillans" /LENGTH=54 /DNA_ID=CAMNT_0039350393 /DNA_START=723 /DNA_END=887 /DNA_ORIENTATION=-